MSARPQRMDALRNLSAIGAGVLLATTPHCGGKSEGTSADASGGTRSHRGGASGSAGSDDGGNGGVGTIGYGGVGASGGTYGGTPGTGGVGYGGGCSMPTQTYCFTPAELVNCVPRDGGIDGSGGLGGTDSTGEGGEGSEGGQAGAAEPARAGAPPDSGAGAPVPPPFECPSPASASFPGCVNADVLPTTYGARTGPTWNGNACCYTYYYCY